MSFSWDNKNAPTKFSWQTQGLGATKEQKVAKEKQNLVAQGLPVSVKKDRAAPTAVGNIIRGAASLVANPVTNIVNAGQIALGRKETQPFSGKYLGKVEGLGKVDITKSPLDPSNLKTLKKSVGTGAEIASFLGYGGIAKTAVKQAVTKTTELAAKQTFKEYAIQNLPKLIKEGAFTGAAYTAGSQLKENAETGKKFSWEQAKRDIALSTVLTPVAVIGLNRVFGKKTSDILDARAKVRADKDAAVLGRPIPDAGTPSPKFMQESNRMLPSPRTPNQIPIELPAPGILKNQELMRNPVRNTGESVANKTPEILRAEKFNSRADFINNERQFFIRTKQKIPATLETKSGKIWDEAHATPSTKPLKELPSVYKKSTPEIPMKTNSYGKLVPDNKPIPKEAPTPVDIPEEAIPEFKARVDEGVNVLDNDKTFASKKFSPSNHKVYSETVYSDIAKDPERVRRIAMGSGEQTTNGVPADAYYAIAKNEAAKSGNVKLIKELSKSDVSSISAQNLEANKLTQEGDIVDTVRDIYKARAKAVGVSEEAIKRNEKTLVEKLKNEVKVMLDKIPTKQEMNDIINSLVCK